ncbi:hypothetical protein ASE86_03195 [Sphingomonas sp. Leaf33]|uniref:hypothetical protein n=1 Tax=Sphingomonas sp. Leaf33 TaxID=1736215 RepID=UPI0006F9EC95|nr:hypothetical protein [Sphingomonas sp. Leaf33]KQN25271.1 hypothetical protein ASE86_03195 [Sphingomonas sp. Leaf33]
MLSTALGALIGGAIDGADGDDSTWDGALAGAATALVVRTLVPVVLTYAVGWGVLKGLDIGKDAVFGKGQKA